LWRAGTDRVDAVIISHADMDHFNGVSGLLQTVPVAEILLSQASLDFQQSGIAALCDAAAAANVPLRLVQSGDRLLAGDDVRLEILHPDAGDGDELDNANSIVLRVEYAGRVILLTGDLEESGLDALLSRPAEAVDVLLSPHHGSRAANPPELAEWAQPAYAVISTGDHGKAGELQEVYGPGCRVLSTADSGAVRVRISPEGELVVEEYRVAPW
jgi:competence protein ComEC